MTRVLITGGGRGIGAAIVARLKIKKSLTVVAPDRSEMDLSRADSVEAFLKNNDPFDVIINNAGINIIKETKAIEDADIELLNAVNLTSPLKIIRHSIDHMKSMKAGHIVNISSIWGVRSKEFRTLYSGSKFGLIGYTKALARELGPHNIFVNAICPGFVNTELTKASLTGDALEALLNQVPLQRMAEPDEIAKLVEFFVTQNSYITGQSIVIDGGFTA